MKTNKASELRKGTPTVLSIVEYWSKTPVELNCKKYWMNPAIDIGEPACFACGYYDLEWGVDHEKVFDWMTAWTIASKKLQRSHIIPVALGGSNDVSNLVMLCKRCNTNNPHTKDRDWYLNWLVNAKNQQFDEINKVSKEAMNFLGNFDMSEIKFSEIQEELERHLHENTTSVINPAAKHEYTFVFETLKFLKNKIDNKNLEEIDK